LSGQLSVAFRALQYQHAEYGSYRQSGQGETEMNRGVILTSVSGAVLATVFATSAHAQVAATPVAVKDITLGDIVVTARKICRKCLCR
jgi:hypothetical protein